MRCLNHRTAVEEFFESDGLEVWAVTTFIAQRAADLGNTYPVLLPGDCVHIATALQSGAPVLFTYDGMPGRRNSAKILAYDGLVATPPLRIMHPFDPWPASGAAPSMHKDSS